MVTRAKTFHSSRLTSPPQRDRAKLQNNGLQTIGLLPLQIILSLKPAELLNTGSQAPYLTRE